MAWILLILFSIVSSQADAFEDIAEFKKDAPHLEFDYRGRIFILQNKILFQKSNQKSTTPQPLISNISSFQKGFILADGKIYFLRIDSQVSLQPIRLRPHPSFNMFSDDFEILEVSSKGLVKYRVGSHIVLAQITFNKEGYYKIYHPKLNNRFITHSRQMAGRLFTVLEDVGKFRAGTEPYRREIREVLYHLDSRGRPHRVSTEHFVRDISQSEIIMTDEPHAKFFKFRTNKGIAELHPILGLPGEEKNPRWVKMEGSLLLRTHGKLYHVVQTSDGHFVAVYVDMYGRRARDVLQIGHSKFISTFVGAGFEEIRDPSHPETELLVIRENVFDGEARQLTSSTGFPEEPLLFFYGRDPLRNMLFGKIDCRTAVKELQPIRIQ